jgi:drug/metabolite transporter (DMT)-like permease
LRLRTQDTGRLVALAAIWGGSFIFLRVLAPVLGPVLTAATRVLIAGAALVLYCRVTGFDTQLRRYWREYVVIGIVNSALPFLLYAFAALHIPASYSVILNCAAPLFAAMLAAVFLGERLTVTKLAGLAAGALGVALVSNAGPVVPDFWFGIAVAACLAGAFCYAAAGVYMKRRAGSTKPLAVAGWSQLFAGLVLLPLAPFAPMRGELTALVLGNVLVLALLCSAIAYLLYYRLIADVGPTRAVAVTLLMPAFGMLWGALFLDETITLSMIAGCALIVGGTIAVLRPASLRSAGPGRL